MVRPRTWPAPLTLRRIRSLESTSRPPSSGPIPGRPSTATYSTSAPSRAAARAYAAATVDEPTPPLPATTPTLVLVSQSGTAITHHGIGRRCRRSGDRPPRHGSTPADRPPRRPQRPRRGDLRSTPP